MPKHTARKKVAKDDLARVAFASRLKLTGSELEKFAGELEKILEAFRELDSIDTVNVGPSLQPVRLSNVLREDKVRPSLPQKDAIKNAKNKEGGFVKGPRVA